MDLVYLFFCFFDSEVDGVLQASYGALRIHTLFLPCIISCYLSFKAMSEVTLPRKSAVKDLISPIWDIPRYCALLFVRHRASPQMTCPRWSQGPDFRMNRNKHPLWTKVVVNFMNTKVGQHFIYTAPQMNLYRPVLTLLLPIAAACEVKLPHVRPCFLQFTLQ